MGGGKKEGNFSKQEYLHSVQEYVLFFYIKERSSRS